MVPARGKGGSQVPKAHPRVPAEGPGLRGQLVRGNPPHQNRGHHPPVAEGPAAAAAEAAAAVAVVAVPAFGLQLWP